MYWAGDSSESFVWWRRTEPPYGGAGDGSSESRIRGRGGSRTSRKGGTELHLWTGASDLLLIPAEDAETGNAGLAPAFLL